MTSNRPIAVSGVDTATSKSNIAAWLAVLAVGGIIFWRTLRKPGS